MAYMHPETEHSIDGDHHEDCLELCEDLLHDLESKQYPEHLIDIVKGVCGELEEYKEDEGLEEEEKVADEKEAEEEPVDEHEDPMGVIISFVNKKNAENSEPKEEKEY